MLHVMNKTKDLTKQRGNWESRAIVINYTIENTGLAKGLKGELDNTRQILKRALKERARIII